MGMKGAIWSSAAMGVLLYEGIGDTIRISLTPRPGGDRREEVYAACELLQALGLRSFSPSVTACPGCGRTTSTTFQELAESIQDYIRDMMPVWKTQYEGVETMTLAVMGCIVNGPGESKAANIGISLPGTGEAPRCPVYIDGKNVTTLEGTYDELAAAFQALVDDYIPEISAPRSRTRTAPKSRWKRKSREDENYPRRCCARRRTGLSRPERSRTRNLSPPARLDSGIYRQTQRAGHRRSSSPWRRCSPPAARDAQQDFAATHARRCSRAVRRHRRRARRRARSRTAVFPRAQSDRALTGR